MGMKRIAGVLMVLLLASGLAYAKDYEITKKAGDYTIQVKIDRNPPTIGKNKMEILLKDATGKDVPDATVAIDYGMPPMPGMHAMNYKTKTEWTGSRYLATLNFSMSGPWYIHVRISHAGTSQLVKFNVDIG
jgi:hypothetical protein